ncbi:polymorphic toxin-type HINT domain-containing protein [Saccharothrix luteola]|uniref:polymorphic toxin-type HINT domain-containing protein n=1 Tax=Saccharothrix luteola TaxID=2893018 RepID=UPI001E3B6A98|nr:polymorphic toxin-type HINT domain-containing protein [Saccharothrix luteola]MCC8242701.1 DNRLRE domain-containing protein [Saccharothrix luteola]
MIAVALGTVVDGVEAAPGTRPDRVAELPRQRWEADAAASRVDPKDVNRHLPPSLRSTYPAHPVPEVPKGANKVEVVPVVSEFSAAAAGLPVGAGRADSSMYVHGSSSAAGGNELRVGRLGGQASASYVKFGGLVDQLRFHTIYGVQLQVVNYDSASCTPKAMTVHPVTQSWSPGTGYSYPGPTTGAALASSSFAHGYVATGQSASGCPASTRLIDLGVAGRDLVQRWVDGRQADHGLSLRGSATDDSAWKRLGGSSTANPPKLFVTHSPYNANYGIPKPVPEPPVLQNQAGKVKVTVTNRSAEAWAPGTYYLAYRAYRTDTGAPAGQQRSADLSTSVARGATVTLDATIQPLPPGRYFLDFTMVRAGGVVFTDHQVPPGRIVLEVFDIPPVVQELHPPNGYQAATLTPQLWARALDIDAPPGSSLRYRFEVCERSASGDPTACFNSGDVTSTAWTVPAAKLKWSKAYLWRVFVKDAGNEVPSPYSAVLTSVPQPAVTSRVAGSPYGTQDKEYDAQIGNFTTAALDAPVVTVGPDLNVLRTYNSLDPRRDSMFGAGWVTRYDMRVRADDDGSGNVVITYPDGQEVRFGRDPDGTFVPPDGRTASLTLDANGWRLRDKSNTVYQFSTGGRLARITDPAGRAIVLTLDTTTTGRLAKAHVANSQSNQNGRALRFTWTGNHVTSVSSDPVDGVTATWTYTYTGDLLTGVCAPGNACTTYDYTPSSHYRTAVQDTRPESYWRLGEAQGTSAGSDVAVNLGKDAATYRDVTLGTPGIAGDNAAQFNGSSSVVDLPKGAVKKSRDLAVELWFKTSATTGGPLIGYQDHATNPTSAVPVLYVGADGKLRGQFATGAIDPMMSALAVNDGQWHHVVLSAMGDVQTLYLDAVKVGAHTRAIDHSLLTVNQVGASHATGTWPQWGAGARRHFAGVIDEVAVYSHPLGQGAVADHHRYGKAQADLVTKVTLPSGKVSAEAKYANERIHEYTDRNGGTWKVGSPAVHGGGDDLRRSVQVLDPANRPHLFEYDALAGRLLRSGLPAGLELREEDRPGEPVPPPDPPQPVCGAPDPGDPQFCTIIPDDAGGPVFVRHPLDGMAIRTYEYDERGYQKTVRNENGDAVRMTYDERGNVTTQTTCRTNTECHTAYSSYRATVTDPLDPTNDLPLETRDARSSGPADNTYRTTYTYTSRGDLASQTGPDGARVDHTYTTGAEVAVGGGTMPAGLVATTTDPRRQVTRYLYYANGDLARVTTPTGLITDYTYDALGRRVTEKETSDSFPSGVSTRHAYDTASRLTSTTEPPTTSAVDGTRHQRRITYRYDADGNQDRVEVSDLLGGDAPRVTTTAYDDRNRPDRVVDPEGGETSYDYDRFGNRTSMVDANGNRYDYAYTARNNVAEIRLRDWRGDPPGSPATGDHIVLHAYTYDLAGRMVSDTNAMGRRLEYDHHDDDLRKSITLKGFRNQDGTTRDYVVEANTYDKAGNLTRQVTGNGATVVENVIDVAGRVERTTSDPAGLARTTAYTYDPAGNVLKVVRSGRPSNVPWVPTSTEETVTTTYDPLGNPLTETVSGGGTSLTTSHTYDRRGVRTSTTDPRGNVTGADRAAFTTTFLADELGRTTISTSPAVAVEGGGTARPTRSQGYNAFDEPTEVKDERGHVSRVGYDQLGRVVRTEEPAYVPPGGTSAITPVTTTGYDPLGNVLEAVDELGNATRLTYDRLNRLVTRDTPAATNDQRAVWRYTYTRTGQVLSVTDPEGGRTESTYDDLERRVTASQVERKPVPRNLTTRFTYDDANNLTSITTPTGARTVTIHNGLGEPTRSTDPAGVVAEQGYDFAGRQVRASDGLGRTTRTDFDAFGRVATEADLAPDGRSIRGQRHGYDAAGNLTSTTDALDRTTTYTYDALNRLTGQVEPVADGRTITTGFGHDLAGNRTSYTDGRGNTTRYTVNSLGLPESVVEPATTAHPAPADRTWTIAYTARGDADRITAPGGVTRQRAFDASGRLERETGAGAESATAERTLGYDLLGRTVKVGTPTGDNTYTYNDRNALLSTSGPSGNANFAYNDDGQLVERSDAAGTSRFGYERGRLTSAVDAVTGTTQVLGYDAAGQVRTIDYGARRVRTFGFDDLGRTTSDVLSNAAGQSAASITYGYDLDDHLTTKTTVGLAGAGANTYGYDHAGRLTSWTSGSTVTEYGWDDSGNRVKAGAKTAAYDERNRLLSDSDYTYGYSARGALASRTSSGLTERYSSDAFDRLVTSGSVDYAYDGLDRLISRESTAFAYAGLDDEVVSDGGEKYARGPADELLAVADGQRKRLTLSDGHDDVVAALDPADTALARPAESVAFDPFGQVAAVTGDRANVGYQGDWTDPTTGDVDMGGRWYRPGPGTFGSRDTAEYERGDSVLANRYTYAAAAPLDHTDPDGEWPKFRCGWCKRAVSAVVSVTAPLWRPIATVATWAWRGIQTVASAAWTQIKRVARVVSNVGRAIVRGVDRLATSMRERAAEIRRTALARAQQITRVAQERIERAVRRVPLKTIAAAFKPIMAGVKLTVSMGSHLAAGDVSALRDVVADLSKSAQNLYQRAVDTYGAVVEGVSKAASVAGDWIVAHKADIAGFGAGLLVGAGCGALIGWTGVGAVACGALAGAVGSVVHDLVEGGHGWKEMTANALVGATLGAVTGGLGSVGGQALKAGIGAARSGGTSLGRAAVSAARSEVDDIARGRMTSGLLSSCNSFAGATSVTLADGTRKEIDSVAVGDEVLATDPTTGVTQARPVTDVITGSGEKRMVEVSVAGGSVLATDGHPFWVDGGEWVEAQDLQEGQRLRTAQGGEVAVTGLRMWTGTTTVYNLTVDGTHTYYVDAAPGVDVLVHNCAVKTPGASLLRRYEHIGKHRKRPGYTGKHRAGQFREGPPASMDHWVTGHRKPGIFWRWADEVNQATDGPWGEAPAMLARGAEAAGYGAVEDSVAKGLGGHFFGTINLLRKEINHKFRGR